MILFPWFIFQVILYISYTLSHKRLPLKDLKVVDSSTPLYYLGTEEGIIAHLRYIKVIHSFATFYNRSIILSNFKSPHYPDMPDINICDYFILPSSITCSNQPAITYLKSKSCVYTGFSRSKSNETGIPRGMVMVESNNFTYNNTECIAGQVLYYSGIFPREQLLDRDIYSHPYLQIKQKFHDSVPIAKKTLGIKSFYSVNHWRRGDELTSRCNSNVINKTINCETADDLIKELDSRLRMHVKHSLLKNMVRYTATNEENETVLQYLQEHGLKIYKDLEVEDLFKEANSLTRFIIELLLMCDADYFVSWGLTQITGYMRDCRRRNHRTDPIEVNDKYKISG